MDKVVSQFELKQLQTQCCQSGSKIQVRPDRAATLLGLNLKSNQPYNAWAAATSSRCPSLDPERYQETYGISLRQGRELDHTIYGK